MAEKVTQLLHLVFKALGYINPSFGLAVFNPRALNDLMPHELTPKILKTNGQITVPVLLWQPKGQDGKVDLDHPIWDNPNVRNVYTGGHVAVPREERHKFFFIVRGHRRLWNANHFIVNEDTFPHSVVENAKKVPAQEVICSQEEAEELAVDQDESKGLHSWNVLAIIFKMFARDYTWQEIARKYPKMLYEAFLNGGVNKYEALLRDPKYVDRNARDEEITTTLRNTMYTWFESCYKFGPALQQQALKYFRYVRDRLEDKSDDKVESSTLVVDLPYQVVQELRKLYNRIDKDGEPWTPVQRLCIVEKPEKGNDIMCKPCPGGVHSALEGRHFLVQGGHPEFQEALIELMEAKVAPEAIKPKAKPLTATKRKEVEQSIAAGCTKALAKLYDREDKEPVGGKYLTEPKTRVEWEQWALTAEAIQARLLKMVDECEPMVQELIRGLTSQTAPNADAERVATAVATINAALKQSTVSPAKATKRR